MATVKSLIPQAPVIHPKNNLTGRAVELATAALSRLVCARVAYQEKKITGTNDKAKGLANERIGNVKRGVGRLVGSDQLEAEGLAQEGKGEAQKLLGDVKAVTDKVAGAIKKNL